MRQMIPAVLATLALAAPVLGQGAPPPPGGQPGDRPRQRGQQDGQPRPQRQGEGQQRQRMGPGGPGGGGMMGRAGGMLGGGDTTIRENDFKRYMDRLKLNGDQRDTAQTLFEGYQSEIKSSDEAMQAKRREAFEKAREDGGGGPPGPEMMDAMRKLGEEAAQHRSKAQQALYDDLKAVLNQDQQSAWPVVERMVRRDQGLRRGRLSGERMDVVRLVEALKLEQAQATAVQPILDAYETEVDRELAARNKVYDEFQSKLGELFRGGDEDAAQREFDKARDAGIKVRDVNQKYARQVQAALPEDKQAAFAVEVKKSSHPEIYRDSIVTRQLAAADKFTDLDESQRKAVTELVTRHQRELGTLNDRLAAVQEEQETKVSVGDLRNRFRGGEPGPAEELRQQRRDLDDSVTESLKKILKPDQFEQLPKPDRRDGGFRGRRNADEEL